MKKHMSKIDSLTKVTWCGESSEKPRKTSMKES